MKTRKIAALAFAVMLGSALISCSSGEAEEAARRSLIIEDYVRGQQANYGWADDATKVSDEEGFVLVEQTSPNSSYSESDSYAYRDESNPFVYTATGQVEADLLKYSLKKNVLIYLYSGDGHLMSVNLGRYPDASEQAQQRTEGKLEEIAASAKAFAANNKEAWFAGFEAYVIENSDNSFSSIEYETGEGETAIQMTMAPDYSAVFDDGYGQQGFDRYWQRFSDSITLHLGTDVRLEFVSSDTGEVERAFESPVREYLYTPNEV